MRRATAFGSTVLLALALVGRGRADTARARFQRGVPAAATTWAEPQIKVVAAAGLLGGDAVTFRPADPLTRGELADALAAWGKPGTALPIRRSWSR